MCLALKRHWWLTINDHTSEVLHPHSLSLLTIGPFSTELCRERDAKWIDKWARFKVTVKKVYHSMLFNNLSSSGPISSQKAMKCLTAYSTSSHPQHSRTLCMLHWGMPTSTVRIPVLVADMGPW